MRNEELAIKKFENRKVHSSFTDNIWDADLADMQMISKFNKRFRFLLCVIDTFSKQIWGILLKHKLFRSVKTQNKWNMGR